MLLCYYVLYIRMLLCLICSYVIMSLTRYSVFKPVIQYPEPSGPPAQNGSA